SMAVARLRSWRRSSQSKSLPSSNFLIRRVGSKVSRDCPQLEHHKSSDECLVERPCGERAEIVDIARLIPLITCADFLAKDFGQRKADDFRRNKRQEPEITLLDLRSALRPKRRRFAAADLDLYFAPARIPAVRVSRIGTPRQTVLRLVVTFVRNGELDSVKRLLERLHHVEDDFFVIVLLNSCEVQIGRKSSLASDKHFSKTGATFESQPGENAALGQKL